MLVEEFKLFLTVKIVKGWRYQKNGTKAADWTDCALIVEHLFSFHLTIVLTYHKPPLEKDYQGPQRTEQQT